MPAKKFDPITKEHTVYVRGYGGITPVGVACQVCPLGLSYRKAGEEFVRVSRDFKLLKITCKFTIQDRKLINTEVVLSASVLLQRELGYPRMPPQNRNLTLEQVYSVARTMRRLDKSLAKELSGTVKEILGTARSLGYSVDGKTPAEITAMINRGEIVVPTE
eukprot:TRINITY_DN14734_c0_g1_i1.p1 TRINITY_DN14734_c0_g1~~TRINITY_DN14734_c0_g1_i1.p1  ORF type:complete len:162 (+),score=19.33 TRINITY_DN14734_c0_g1_i1:283-768(+)